MIPKRINVCGKLFSERKPTWEATLDTANRLADQLTPVEERIDHAEARKFAATMAPAVPGNQISNLARAYLELLARRDLSTSASKEPPCQ